jgi:hypothetical protein
MFLPAFFWFTKNTPKLQVPMGPCVAQYGLGMDDGVAKLSPITIWT